jgi:hypothetical protein
MQGESSLFLLPSWYEGSRSHMRADGASMQQSQTHQELPSVCLEDTLIG